MSEPFLGEIRMFGFNFAPRSWAFCDGQLVAISQNEALFSLLGTIYGGDGRTTFGLPEMRSRIPVHAGQGSGLTQRRLGSKSGQESVTLVASQVPQHNHTVQASLSVADTPDSSGKVLADTAPREFYASPENLGPLHSGTIGNSGGGQAHNNVQPYLAINFCIALAGVFPSRS